MAVLSNLRERLKSETLVEHQATEKNLAFLMSQNVELTKYIQLLKNFARIYQQLDQAFGSFAGKSAAADFYIAENQKTERLTADLKFLEAEDGLTQAQPIDADLNTILHTEAARWGLLYVIEGSSLGGQMIAMHLKKTMGLEAGAGASFFAGDQQQTGKRWREFLAQLENPATLENPEAAVTAARNSFRWMGRMLSNQNSNQGALQLNS